MVFGRVTWLLTGAMAVACMVLLGPSAPSDAFFGRSLDFNAVPDAPELTRIWALATDTDPRCQPAPTGTCEPTTDWHSKFDYVFLRGIAPLRHRVQPSPYTDHHLLYADLAPIRSASAGGSAR